MGQPRRPDPPRAALTAGAGQAARADNRQRPRRDSPGVRRARQGGHRHRDLAAPEDTAALRGAAGTSERRPRGRAAAAPRVAGGGDRPAAREGPDRPLRATRHRQDVCGQGAMRAPHRRRRRLRPGAVPPLLRLRGLLRGIPAPYRSRRVRHDLLRAGPRPAAAAGRQRRRRPRPSLPARHRRAEPRQPRQGLRGAVLPAGVPRGDHLAAVLRPAVHPAQEPVRDRHHEHRRPLDRPGRRRHAPTLRLRALLPRRGTDPGAAATLTAPPRPPTDPGRPARGAQPPPRRRRDRRRPLLPDDPAGRHCAGPGPDLAIGDPAAAGGALLRRRHQRAGPLWPVGAARRRLSHCRAAGGQACGPGCAVTRYALAEYGRAEGLDLDRDDALALSQTRAVRVSPSLTAVGRFDVTAAQFVGVVRSRGCELWVRPKLPVSRLLFLLGYANDSRGWHDDDPAFQEADNLVEALVRAFIRHAERALARGLLQGYQSVEDAQPAIRGRVREADQLRRRFGLPLPVEVRYDDYTTDIDDY